jgi:ribosomal protein L11 methyltransferase
MKWMEAKVFFDFKDKQLAVDLISDLFYDLDLKGVVVEGPEIEGFEDWGRNADTHENDAVIGYLPYDNTLGKKQKAIDEGLARLENQIGITYSTFYTEVDDSDWAESWKAYFQPVKITDQIVVKPTWRDYPPNDEKIIIEIDPGMAFGIGSHPTTCMCITMVEKYLKRNNTFLDIGTGSGILMIVAAKLGAGKMWGTDNDAVAVEIARRNLIHNRIPKSVFNVIACDMVDRITERFDLVAANLATKTILNLFENIKRVLHQDGIFIFSGILETDKGKILKKLEDLNYRPIEILLQEEWISMACRRTM